ncbi:hypothetical protein AB0I84_50775 [Streptomyces spectabilis]
MSDAWPEYVAGVLALATGAAASALVNAWRRRRPRPDEDLTPGNRE